MKTFVKNPKKTKDEDSEFKVGKVLEGARKYRERRFKPTSVLLDEETTQKLKKIAQEKGIPYQVLMRSFILEGIGRLEKDKRAGETLDHTKKF
jgi:predicted DNA binding CopG/RHH family protein